METSSLPLQPIPDPGCADNLRHLNLFQLTRVAAETRNHILRQVARSGGHLASNLGTVELTVALHHVMNLPHDRLVWDVGHQAYAHKILTGRRERFTTLRRNGGLSGFPNREESPFDAFGTGHSSTSISAALGMAVAARHKGERRRVVAVIGDGALSAGLAYEALNNAGAAGADLLVVLNDNDMSISPPVGSLRRHLTDLAPHRQPGLDGSEPQARVEASLFENLGFSYDGPVDGHDMASLVAELSRLRDVPGPRLLHVVTRKGQGYAAAEADPVGYHAPAPFDIERGVQSTGAAAAPTFTSVFGQWLCDMADADPRLVAITPAMREGSGLVKFEQRHPSRYHDVGIAEQHAVTFAAGLACEGLKPVVAIYSTFLQRAYDQVIHDVALQNLPVTFAIDRGGLVGADGATHAGAYDIAFMRCVPNLAVLTPSDEDECRRALSTAYAHDGPAAVRYPRGRGVGTVVQPSLNLLPFGKGELRRVASCLPGSGLRVAILAFGPLLHAALAAAETLDATVANMRFVKPLDAELIRSLAGTHQALVTVEEGCVAGGAGSAVLQALADAGIEIPTLVLGLPDRFIEHGEPASLLTAVGLDATGIENSIRQRFGLTDSYPIAPKFALLSLAAADNTRTFSKESVC